MNDRFKFRHYNELAKSFTYYENPELQVDLNRDFKSGLVFPLAEEQGLYMGTYSELQQCTGLKDKNGKLIYEGDIVKNKYADNYIVSWNNKGFWQMDTYAIAGFNNLIQEEMQVIGNIYENKELLEMEE